MSVEKQSSEFWWVVLEMRFLSVSISRAADKIKTHKLTHRERERRIHKVTDCEVNKYSFLGEISSQIAPNIIT